MKVPNKITLDLFIKNGSLPKNNSYLKAFLNHFNECFISVTLHKKRNKRSNKQNAYYWGVIIPIMQNAIKNEYGEIYLVNEVHEFLKTNCNFKEIVKEETGQILRKVKSTKENNTKEQEEFMQRCRTLAKDFFNVEIPLPNEKILINF